jgi:predicted CopG family antitoxin
MTWQVKVDEDTWRRLNARKRPGDSFEDVIERMLDDVESDQPLEAEN